MTRSESAPSGTFSTKLVFTAAPSAAAQLVLEGPAGIADGGDIDEADLEGVGRGGTAWQGDGRQHQRRGEQGTAGEAHATGSIAGFGVQPVALNGLPSAAGALSLS